MKNELAALTREQINAFSLTTEKIYDAAMDPKLWETALADIRSFVNGSSIALHYASADPGKFGAAILYSVGFSKEFLRDSTLYERGWAAQIGLLDWRIGDVRHLPDILPAEEYLNGLFYKNVIMPHREFDYVGMVALKEAGTIVPLTVSTTVDHGPFTPQNIKALRLLAPHICRAVKISLALEMKNLDASLMETTLNGLQAGVYIVGRDGRIAFMNQTAEQQIKRGYGVTIQNQRLVPTNAAAAAEYQEFFVEAHEKLSVPKSSRPSIAFPDEQGGLVATLLPLGVGKRKMLALGATTAGYAVFVQDPAIAFANPGEGFAKLYGLSSAEMRIIMVMAEGNGISETADILGLSNATVKSHLQHMFAKTGTSRQSDLMQLVIRSLAPINKK
jgi:DNA-binding CsgD family transcriptional regulator/PAS domain-containing protein